MTRVYSIGGFNKQAKRYQIKVGGLLVAIKKR